MQKARYMHFKRTHKSSWMLWAIVAYIICVAIVCIEVNSSYNLIISTTKNDISSLLRVTGNRLSELYLNTYLRIENTLLKIKILETKQSVTKKNLHDLMVNLNSENQYLLTAITDKNGKHITSSAILDSKVDLSEREYFKTLKNSKDLNFIISEPVISKTHGKWVMVFARKLTTEKGAFNGMLLVTFPMEWLTEILRTSLDKPGSNATLLTEKLNIITRWPYSIDQIGKTVKINKPTFFDQNEFDELISPVDQERRIVGRRYVLNNQWILSLGFTHDSLFTKWWIKVYIYVGLFTSFMLALVILHYRQSQLEELMAHQEAQLINSAKLSSLGEMAGGIAHEINNPMAIIQMSFDLMQRELKDIPLNETKSNKLNNYFNKVTKATERVTTVIQKIRRISSDQAFEPHCLYDLSMIIKSVTELYQPKFIEKNINFIYHPPEKKLELICQELTVQQVLMNILNNAIDAVEGDTPLHLGIKWVKLDLNILETSIEIKISNSGPKISDEVQQKMMEPFYTTKSFGRGVGLGLPLAKKFMDENNGELYLDKNESHTTFVLKFRKIAA